MIYSWRYDRDGVAQLKQTKRKGGRPLESVSKVVSKLNSRRLSELNREINRYKRDSKKWKNNRKILVCIERDKRRAKRIIAKIIKESENRVNLLVDNILS